MLRIVAEPARRAKSLRGPSETQPTALGVDFGAYKRVAAPICCATQFTCASTRQTARGAELSCVRGDSVSVVPGNDECRVNPAISASDALLIGHGRCLCALQKMRTAKAMHLWNGLERLVKQPTIQRFGQ